MARYPDELPSKDGSWRNMEALKGVPNGLYWFLESGSRDLQIVKVDDGYLCYLGSAVLKPVSGMSGIYIPVEPPRLKWNE